MFGLHKQFIQKDLFDILKSEIDFNQDSIVVGEHKIKEERNNKQTTSKREAPSPSSLDAIL